MCKQILETQRLILREMTDEDFPALCRMLRDPEVMYAYAHGFSEEESWDWLRRQQSRYETDGFGLWAMIEKKSGRMIGQCGLTMQALADGTGGHEVGERVEKAAWGNGWATEAAVACRQYAFEVLGVEEVYSIIRENNLPSQRVALRNGMKVTGQLTKHYYGMEMPHLVFSVRRESVEPSTRE